MLWKCYTQYASKFWKLVTGLDNVSFHSNPKESQSSNYCTIALISHTSKVMLKILQARLKQYVNWELQDVQAEFRKSRGNTSNCQHSFTGSQRKVGNSRETSTSTSFSMWKTLTVWITTNCGKFFKRWEYQTILPVSWEICMRVKKQ